MSPHVHPGFRYGRFDLSNLLELFTCQRTLRLALGEGVDSLPFGWPELPQWKLTLSYQVGEGSQGNLAADVSGVGRMWREGIGRGFRGTYADGKEVVVLCLPFAEAFLTAGPEESLAGRASTIPCGPLTAFAKVRQGSICFSRYYE